ncbi:tail fiber domain-containing protein [Thioalkalivibrio thiocyanodenitrificans]|uniref:tail fiber domain-containing protein n=1 Tax=Thioalkalivibrio thiocyanodenitrificans TaxID=243063 RepID=UPI000A0088BD|nr:tail fiber domain-containing protein [Thioalkalivibrio thiocyanodenitrificans]
MFQPSISGSVPVRQGLMVSVLALVAILYSPLPQQAVHQAGAGILTLVASSAHASGEMYVEPEGVGIGTANPQRQLHLVGNNAVFRMDRSANTAAFLMVRTDAGGTPLKTFVVGTNASGSDNGEFIITDLGTALGGSGARRLTITNDGEAHFTGTVRAPAFVQTSSARLKDNVETLRHARLAIQQLRGVRFSWKDSGEASLGVIAEEVQAVYPELVDTEDGMAAAVNYSALVAVLVEAVKEQQTVMDDQQKEIAAQQARMKLLENRLAEIALLKARLADVEDQLTRGHLQSATLLE